MKLKILLPLLLLAVLGSGMTKPDRPIQDEFSQRRAIFLDQLREMNACAILHSAPEMERNHDVGYPYRQSSELIYLTGWPYMNCILLLTPGPARSDKAEVLMFVEPRNPKSERWTGPRSGLVEARALPGVDLAYPYSVFFDSLSSLTQGFERWVVSPGNDAAFETELLNARKQAKGAVPLLQNTDDLLKLQRLIKSDSELQAIEKAIEITAAALVDAYPVIPRLGTEFEVQAEIEYGIMKRGAPRLGFPSIIGAGKHGTYLHYEANRGQLNAGELILMDVGAEWDYYSADITRTIPLNGKFNPQQAAIYNLVLDAQDAAIKTIKPGVSWRQPHDKAIEVITTGLVELGLLDGAVDSLIADRSYRRFFMHGTSHWLGLDVHDAGGYLGSDKTPIILEPGMVLTVEPGIYISEAEDLDSKWWNIAVRIEDDVLVTALGYRLLSQAVPRKIKEIEQIMQP